jgi:hypothetical protein
MSFEELLRRRRKKPVGPPFRPGKARRYKAKALIPDQPPALCATALVLESFGATALAIESFAATALVTESLSATTLVKVC